MKKVNGGYIVKQFVITVIVALIIGVADGRSKRSAEYQNRLDERTAWRRHSSILFIYIQWKENKGTYISFQSGIQSQIERNHGRYLESRYVC